MSLILALDAGTTSMKGCLFDLSGTMLSCCVREYALEKPSPDVVEVDPEVYWRAAVHVIAEVLKTPDVKPEDICSLGVTGQGETLIVLDKEGKPLRKAIVWLDNRARKEAVEIDAQFGRDNVYEVTGQQDIVAGWPAPKILWLHKHEPEVLEAASRFLMLEDYLVYRLTGRFATDHALNPSTLYYDLRRGCWWESMLDFLEISSDQLPDLLESGMSAGVVTADVGLSPETTVRVAPIDQVAAMVGAGSIYPSVITETTGSAMALCANVGHPTYDPKKRLGLYRHAVPDLFVLMAWIPTAGMLLRWFRDEFAPNMDYAELGDAAAGIAPGSNGLTLLPHFSGMVSPEVNPDARGVLFGLTLSHHRAHFVRAIMESVAFSLRDNLEALAEMGVVSLGLISLGGAARSGPWLQIKADVLQTPIQIMQCEETTSLGAAALAAAGEGRFESIEPAVQAMVHPQDVIQPDPERRDVYEQAFRRYKELERTLF